MGIQIKTITMNLSAASKSQFPQDGLPQIAFAGRSNVGKSSCINTLVGRKKIAYVSQTPGKTRTINFYKINDEFYFVDLPGYGYAKLSKEEQLVWDRMMHSYFEENHSLLHLFLLVDVRHEVKTVDLQMAEYIRQYEYPFSLIATKTDKVNRGELNISLQRFSKGFLMDQRRIFPLSSLKKTGKEKILEHVAEIFETASLSVSHDET